MRIPTTRTIATCAGVGAIALAAIAIPAWAKSDEDSSGDSGSRERAGRPAPMLPLPTAENRRRFERDLEEFRDCLKEHGVDLPDPAGPRGFVIPAPGHDPGRDRFPLLPREGDRKQLAEAREECGAPPLPRPPFAGPARGDLHECVAQLPRRR